MLHVWKDAYTQEVCVAFPTSICLLSLGVAVCKMFYTPIVMMSIY